MICQLNGCLQVKSSQVFYFPKQRHIYTLRYTFKTMSVGMAKQRSWAYQAASLFCCSFLISFFLKLIVACRLCVIYVSEDYWCAILITHQLLWQNMEAPVSFFQESPLAGESRQRLFHIHSINRYQLRIKYLYLSTLLWQIHGCNL